MRTAGICIHFGDLVLPAGKKNIGENGIGLYRNTSIAFPQQWQIDKLLNEELGARQGTYYCPDYVVKIKRHDQVGYIIMDAKFSMLDQVKGIYLPCLAYKYLFSLSPLRETERILGLCLVNGKSFDLEDKIFDVYDLAQEGHQIRPFACILTLTENGDENDRQHLKLIKNLLNV